jgi:hypothetical protein
MIGATDQGVVTLESRSQGSLEGVTVGKVWACIVE